MPAPKFSFSKILTDDHGESGYTAKIKTSVATDKETGEKTSFANLFLERSLVETQEWDGKVLEFLNDPVKSAIAFRILTTLRKEDWNKKTMRMIKVNKSGLVQLGITKILAATRIPLGNYKCPLLKYDDSVYGELFYFQLEVEAPKRGYKKHE